MAFTFRNKPRCQNASSLQTDLRSGRDFCGLAVTSPPHPPTPSIGNSKIPPEVVKQGLTIRVMVIRGHGFERPLFRRNRSRTQGCAGQPIYAVCCGQRGLCNSRWMPNVAGERQRTARPATSPSRTWNHRSIGLLLCLTICRGTRALDILCRVPISSN